MKNIIIAMIAALVATTSCISTEHPIPGEEVAAKSTHDHVIIPKIWKTINNAKIAIYADKWLNAETDSARNKLEDTYFPMHKIRKTADNEVELIEIPDYGQNRYSVIVKEKLQNTGTKWEVYEGDFPTFIERLEEESYRIELNDLDGSVAANLNLQQKDNTPTSIFSLDIAGQAQTENMHAVFESIKTLEGTSFDILLSSDLSSANHTTIILESGKIEFEHMYSSNTAIMDYNTGYIEIIDNYHK